MRHEIFKQIEQNRNKFFAELNKSRDSNISDVPLIPEEKHITSQRSTIHISDLINMRIPSVSLPVLPTLKNKNIDIDKVKSQFVRFIKPLSDRLFGINSTIRQNGQRVSDGFYKFSSNLFEDRYEEVQFQNIENNSMNLNLVISRSQSWNFVWDTDYVEQEKISLNERIELVKNQLKRQIRNWYHNTVLFFEYDPGIEEMNTRQLIVEQDIEKKEIVIPVSDDSIPNESYNSPEDESETQKNLAKNNFLLNLKKMESVISFLYLLLKENTFQFRKRFNRII